DVSLTPLGRARPFRLVRYGHNSPPPLYVGARNLERCGWFAVAIMQHLAVWGVRFIMSVRLLSLMGVEASIEGAGGFKGPRILDPLQLCLSFGGLFVPRPDPAGVGRARLAALC